MNEILSEKSNGNSRELYDTLKTKLLRDRMVQLQLVNRGIVDPRVLCAMKEVPRHWFCSQDTPDDDAYEDTPLPIGFGQTISQPFMVAEMLQQMMLTGEENVLEIGSGSGYNASLLSCLAKRVITVEIVSELAERAQKKIFRGNFHNVEVFIGDGSLGWEVSAPYDAIAVTAGAPAIPAALQEQLSVGGRLVIPVGNLMLQNLLVVQRTNEGFQTNKHGGCRFVPLHGKNGWQ